MKTFIISIITVEGFATVELKFDKLFVTKGETWKPESENKFPVKIVAKAFAAMLMLRVKMIFNRQPSTMKSHPFTTLALTARATLLKTSGVFAKPVCASSANTKKSTGLLPNARLKLKR